MSFDWEAFLTLAEELVQHTDDEAALRSTVSRAYYAAYGKARNYLDPEGNQFSDLTNSHKAVWDQLRRSGGTRRMIGELGTRLREHRNKADYENEVANLPELAKSTIRTSKNILAYLKSLGSSQ